MDDIVVKKMLAEATAMIDEQKKHIKLSDENFYDCYGAESILIPYEYEGELPDVSKFHNLKKLHVIRSISLMEFEKLDLTHIEDLYINFKEKPSLVAIKGPKLKKLTVYISNNENDQMTLFEPAGGIIDISACFELEEIQLRHCTGYTIQTEVLPFVKKVVCADCRYYDFEFLRFTPNLLELCATSCKLHSDEFLKLVPRLRRLDLNRNELRNVDIVFGMKYIEFLNLYRNPLDNVDKYKALPYVTYITEKDGEFSSFKGSVKDCMRFAYHGLKSARNPDVHRPPIAQKMYDQQTDEQIFAYCFARSLKNEIERRVDGEKGFWSYKLHTKDELVVYLLKEYPFLEGLL